VNIIKSGRDAAGGAAYNMRSPLRSKKMARKEPSQELDRTEQK